MDYLTKYLPFKIFRSNKVNIPTDLDMKTDMGPNIETDLGPNINTDTTNTTKQLTQPT